MSDKKTSTPDTPDDVTREGVRVEPGQVWEDLDKRQSGRQVRVVSVGDGKAVVEPLAGGTRTRLSVSRMHKHSTGFRLVR